MNATVLNAINEQINSEFEASYTYLAMAGFCEQQKFLGAAKWLRMQSEEERLHGLPGRADLDQDPGLVNAPGEALNIVGQAIEHKALLLLRPADIDPERAGIRHGRRYFARQSPAMDPGLDELGIGLQRPFGFRRGR